MTESMAERVSSSAADAGTVAIAQAVINKAMRMRCMAEFLRAARSFAHVLVGEPGPLRRGHAPAARGRGGTCGTAVSLGQVRGKSGPRCPPSCRPECPDSIRTRASPLRGLELQR